MTNLPVEFENRMKEMLGAEYDEFRASYDDKKKTGIRVNTLKIRTEDLIKVFPGELIKVPWCDKGFMAAGDEKFGRSALHDAGAFYMQEPSAMAVAAGIAEKVDLKGKEFWIFARPPAENPLSSLHIWKTKGFLFRMRSTETEPISFLPILKDAG